MSSKKTKNADSLRPLRSFAATHELGDIFDNRLIRAEIPLGYPAAARTLRK
jgi:hypothetical protein